MKQIRKILIGIGFLTYAATVILTNIEFGETEYFNDDSVNVVLKNEMISSLAGKYNSLILTKSSADFTDGYIKGLLNNVAIIDTLSTDVVEKGGESFIYVEAKSDNNGRIFAKLKCDDSIVEKVKNKIFPGALLAARIVSVNKVDVEGEVRVDDYPGTVNIGEDVLLTGECLEFIELSNS
jgi:hypothetical protein